MASLGTLGALHLWIAGAHDQCTRGTGLKLRGLAQCSSRSFRIVCFAKKSSLSTRAPSTLTPEQPQLEVTVEEDVILEGLNELANDALQVMLGKKSKSIDDCLEDLDEAGEYLVNEGKLDAARFLLVIKHMLDHRVIPEKNELQGPYKKAFEKIWSCVEDSGWSLEMPRDEGGVVMLDDELIPPVLNQLPSV